MKSESYKSKGLTGSLDLGYTHKPGEFKDSQGSKNEWYIQPQAQSIWMGVDADDPWELKGMRSRGEGEGNLDGPKLTVPLLRRSVPGCSLL
ncbi:TPA: autotransporter outer membrane beta-barrel domain-containing protein [Enterobacter cancerogenus]|uniref:autotransporter outer membrane beta-barrel domain-containing protein n=1 Tax=Enterobacter cancerogenus TaxID=69218 RepID=UPI0021CC4FDE